LAKIAVPDAVAARRMLRLGMSVVVSVVGCLGSQFRLNLRAHVFLRPNGTYFVTSKACCLVSNNIDCALMG
jgi:hypothetical protein